MPSEAPAFTLDTPLLVEAFRFARDAHENRGTTSVEHPAAVAELLAEAGFPDEVVAAALLHDVVEDTGVGLDDIERSFDSEIGQLVAAMTEDASIKGYARRKAEHRARVAAHSREAAAIYAADKLAKLQAAKREDRVIRPRKLRHYIATLQELRRTHPDLPFLDELDRELATVAHA